MQRLAGQRLLRDVDGERRADEEDDREQRDQDGDGAVLTAVPDLPGAHSILIRLVLTRLIVLPPNIGPTGVTHGCR